MGDGLKRAFAATAASRRPGPVPGVYSPDQVPERPRRGAWQQTYTGRQYWPLDPRPDEVEAEDIAHHLSLLCRYAGACQVFYSVAEHSVHVSHVVEQHLLATNCPGEARQQITLRALLHDGAEAYCVDIPRPLKQHLPGYKEIEQRNEAAILCRFGVEYWYDCERIVKDADNAMRLAEQAAIMRPPPQPWEPIDVPADMLEAARTRLRLDRHRWAPGTAKKQFLRRLRELRTP